jgi:hypothetical protein
LAGWLTLMMPILIFAITIAIDIFKPSLLMPPLRHSLIGRLDFRHWAFG